MLSICDNGHWKRVSQSCNQAGCETGYEGWASKEGARIEEVLEAMKREVFPTKQVVHVVLAPSEDLFGLPFRELREIVREAARKTGCWSGALIFHPFRERCRVCGLRKALDDDLTGQLEACKCASSTFDWVWSPHFHYIGFAWVENANKVSKELGVVVRNMGVRRSVKGTVSYLLSHAGVWEGEPVEAPGMFPSSEPSKGVFHYFQSITWLRPLRVKFTFPKRSKEVRCEVCGAPTVRVKLSKELEEIIGPGQRGEVDRSTVDFILSHAPLPPVKRWQSSSELTARRGLELEWRREVRT